MQTQNRLFDDLARVAGGALGAFSGLREEIELLVRGRIERVLGDMELVPREEFEVVKAMAAEARQDNEALKARLDALEERLKAKPSANSAARRPAPRRTAAAGALPLDTTPPDDSVEGTMVGDDQADKA
jgi:BMFP domain-containing protein YqiC